MSTDYPKPGPSQTGLSLMRLTALVWVLFSAWAMASDGPLIDPANRASLTLSMQHLEPHLPPAGGSAFDALFTVERDGSWVYHVPYPFSRLMDRLDRAVGIESADVESSLKSVLIPFSRCVNRDLVNPRQLSFPRMVVGVDSESSTVAEERPVFIKNRVFLGYQPKANIIEVISYNDAAGRFEFQVVSDYREGGKPKVEYANRTLCISCHQNGGPIFSRAPWSETSSDNEISEQLMAEGAGGIDRLIYPTGTVDRATDQARLFNAYQMLWGSLCEGKNRNDSIRCRAGLFELMLEKRFFRIRGAYTDSEHVSKFFVPIAGVNFIERWPSGIPVPTADIPNRRPMRIATPTMVTPRVDPLRPRPTRLVLPFEEISRLIDGLAQFLPFADIKSLNDYLYDANPDPARVRWRYRGSCEIVNHDHGYDQGLLSVECQVSDRSLHRHFNMLGDLSIHEENVVSREPLNRWLVGDGMFFNDVYHEGSPISIDGDNWKITLRFNSGDSGLHVWLPDGAAMETVVIRWPRNPGEQTPIPSLSHVTGDAVMTLRPGYERIETAIMAMVERAEAGELDVFDSGAFRGGAVIQALLSEMGEKSTPWCCDDWSQMPAPERVEALPVASADSTLAGFNLYCAECHALPSHSPSSFLSGSAIEVAEKLNECAEQIYYRLGMWDMGPKQRGKTPMPPMLHIMRLEQLVAADQMRGQLNDLRNHVAMLLERSAADVMENGYENTKPCGPF